MPNSATGTTGAVAVGIALGLVAGALYAASWYAMSFGVSPLGILFTAVAGGTIGTVIGASNGLAVSLMLRRRPPSEGLRWRIGAVCAVTTLVTLGAGVAVAMVVTGGDGVASFAASLAGVPALGAGGLGAAAGGRLWTPPEPEDEIQAV